MKINEEKLEELWDKLKSRDPQWELRIEFGKMLMLQYETMTPEQLERYNELKFQLKEFPL